MFKRIFLVVFVGCLLILTQQNSKAGTEREVKITKLGGIFGGYLWTSERHRDNKSTLKCRMPGFTACEFEEMPSELVEFDRQAQVDDLFNHAELQVLSGNSNGSFNENIIKEDGTIYYRTIYWNTGIEPSGDAFIEFDAIILKDTE